MKKILLTTLQVLVTFGILFWVFHDPKKRAQMADALRNADKWWMLAGVGAYGCVEFIATIRWHALLAVQGIRLGWARTGMLTMIGVFFNLFLPGGTGGDVVKVFYLLKETPAKKPAAFLAVLMDRLVGLLALITLTGVLMAKNYHWLIQSSATAKLVFPVLVILLSGFVGVAFSFVTTGFGLVHKLPKHMPFHDKFVELTAAYNLYGRAWKASLFAFVLSIAAHLGYFVTFYFAAKSYETAVPRVPTLGELFAVMPIVNTITALPISLSGAGVREGIFQTFLGDLCGVAPGVAVIMSLTGFMVMAFWAAVGGVVYLLYRPSEHARLSEIEHEVEEIEEKITHAE